MYKKISILLFILLLLFIPAYSAGSVSKTTEEISEDKFKFYSIVFLILAIFGLIFMVFGIYYFGVMLLILDLILIAFTLARYYITLS